MIRPSNDRKWDVDYARTPSAAVEGDLVTFTNFRDFDYTHDGKVAEVEVVSVDPSHTQDGTIQTRVILRTVELQPSRFLP